MLKKIIRAIKNPRNALLMQWRRLAGYIKSDKLYVQVYYRLYTGKKLNLKNPQTYNEKLQWLKLYNRKPEYTELVDKYEVKKIVSKKIGEEYIIPTLGIWDRFEDIDFEQLPDSFVLKTTHDSGGVVICKNKQDFDIEDAKNKLAPKMGRNQFYINREWPYKNVKPRILAEKYMVDESGKDLQDYKFFCFDGVPKALFIATERSTGDVKFDYFDIEFNNLGFKQVHEQSEKPLVKPRGYEEMIRISRILSKGFPHVRIDLYDVYGKVYFGEITFFHHSGVELFDPPKWDYIFGNWINLPAKSNS